MSELVIVHVSTQCGWHGGEEQIRLLCEGLRERGHRIVIAAHSEGVFLERMLQADFEAVALNAGGRNLRSIWKLRKLLQATNPDVVHFHDPHALSCGGLAAWGLNVPARVVSRRVDFPIRSAWRYHRLADCVIAVSNAVANVCRASGISSSRLHVVHDGVDPGRAKSGDRQRGRASLGLDDKTRLVLTVATLTDHKGHKYLLQGVPSVLRERPDTIFAFAGDGELRAELAREVQQLQIENHVRFLGFRQDIPDLLHAADLFVLPSHLEGLGSSLIDVMFARRPIVTTTAGGIPDVVGGWSDVDAPVALLVPPKDSLALSNAILQAIHNPRALETMVDRAYLRAGRFFSAEQMVAGSLKVYEQQLSAAARTRS